MGIEVDGFPDQGSCDERFQRFNQRLTEIDAALEQLGRSIAEAQLKSKYVISEVVPAVPET
jgi:hypothetical protein